jgi:acetyl esterase/lipase
MSWQMKALALYLRITSKSRFATAAAGARRLAAPKGPSAPPSALTRQYDVSRATIDTFNVYTVRKRAQGATRGQRATIIYLHGGAYINEILPPHWKLIGDLANETGAQVVVPIYGLAPSHHVDEAIGLIGRVLDIATTVGPTYLIGDSAGGTLAISATLTWLRSGGTPPRGITAIAPWLDASLSDPAIDEVEARDPWLTRPGLAVCARSWAGRIDLTDQRISPLYGDFTGMPPIDLYVGDRDITVVDCRSLRDRLPSSQLNYHEQPGAVHVYPLLPSPEGRAARLDLIAHIKSSLSQ